MDPIYIETKIGLITMSAMEEKDVIPKAEYFYNSPHDFLASIGFDLSVLPNNKKEYINNYQNFLQQNSRDPKAKINQVVFRHNNQAIGHTTLSTTTCGAIPNAHFHIWKANLRGIGLGKLLITEGLKYLMNINKVKTAYIEPKFDNLPMNNLMKKCGFEFLGDYTFKGKFTYSFSSKRYLIDLSKLEGS